MPFIVAMSEDMETSVKKVEMQTFGTVIVQLVSILYVNLWEGCHIQQICQESTRTIRYEQLVQLSFTEQTSVQNKS